MRFHVQAKAAKAAAAVVAAAAAAVGKFQAAVAFAGWLAGAFKFEVASACC